MTTWIVKNEEIENWIDEWKKAILKKFADRDMIVADNMTGTFWAPSKKKKYYRTGGFIVAKDAFKKESVSYFLKAISFAFFLVEKEKISTS